MAGLMALASALAPAARGQAYPETEVKAVFLLNFAKFVEWPPEAFSGAAAPVVIGVLGEDPFGPTLDRVLEGESLNGRAFRVERYASLDELRPCHVLYVSPPAADDLPAVVKRLKGARTLTVGETERFARGGGVIGFVVKEGRVRFVIDRRAAENAGLKISSRLLSIAEVPRQRGGAP
jgi:hypothetical protein